MINEYEYKELLKDPEMVQVLQRFMAPEQLKAELHEAELDSAMKSMMTHILTLQRKLYNSTMEGDSSLDHSCGTNKVLYEKLKYTLNELGYKVSRQELGGPQFYNLHIEW